MRRIAVVGAGQSGAQLALGLQAAGQDVTLVTVRTPEQVRSGPVLSSQCMFDSALQTERDLGLDLWADDCPPIEGIAFRSRGADGVSGPTWSARLDAPAQSVDQRVKCAGWIERFAAGPGEVRYQRANVADLEDLAAAHDLVVVSTGRGEVGQVFPRNPEHSPYDRPQREVAVTYLHGMAAREGFSAVSYSTVPGVGELFTFPALTTSGACDILVFEAIPGGLMDRFGAVRTPAEHLACSLEILRELFAEEYARCADVRLTDDNGILRGRITPTVRHPVATLPSGRTVLGLGDAVVLSDPIASQGANAAAEFANHYLERILQHGEEPFDTDWMRRTFDTFWHGWAGWVVSWTNSLLAPPLDHHLRLQAEAADSPTLAQALAGGFDDPRTLMPWWFDAQEADRAIAGYRAAHAARFEPRALRRALGQFASGVTIVTTRAADGRLVGMTANSFTSVSMDPPLVLWCPGRESPSMPDFAAAGHFAVNVLASDQHHLSRQLATPAEDKFVGVEVVEGLGGVPLIVGAVARFQCRTVRQIDAGDHVIILGEIERYDADGGEPLVFHSGAYQLTTKHPDV